MQPQISLLGALNAATGSRGVRDGYVTAHVGGTFVGTLSLLVTPNGPEIGAGATAREIAMSTTITAPGVVTYGPFAGSWSVRVQMTAYTSGAADVALACGGILSR
jgi:hypothetical protein